MIFENFSADSCIDSQKENFTISYFGSLQYLQTVAFTIGYGHITPMCHLGKVGSLIIISKIINSKLNTMFFFHFHRLTLSFLPM